MNERIRELIEQAGPLQEVLSEITEQTNDKAPRYIRSMTLLDFQLKTFAELIIKECTEQIIVKGTDWIDFAPSQLGIRPEYAAMAKHIKEHFGVEE